MAQKKNGRMGRKSAPLDVSCFMFGILAPVSVVHRLTKADSAQC